MVKRKVSSPQLEWGIMLTIVIKKMYCGPNYMITEVVKSEQTDHSTKTGRTVTKFIQNKRLKNHIN
jgi:hypothetical protein